MSDSVALWTTDVTTVVLAHVSVAFWAVPNDDSVLLSAGRWRRTLIDESTCFVIECLGGGSIYFDGDNHRAYGISFLRALSTYWETRS